MRVKHKKKDQVQNSGINSEPSNNQFINHSVKNKTVKR